jgi:hypothetical protein
MILFRNATFDNSSFKYCHFSGPQNAIQLADETYGSEDSPKNSGILQIENAILLIPAYEQKVIFHVASLNITNSKFNNCVITGENYSEAVTLNNCIVDKHLIITTMLGLKYTIRYYQFFLISMEVGKILVY